MVFLIEIKVGRQQIDRIINLLQIVGSFVVDSEKGGGGGLALLWKEMSRVSLINYFRNHINVTVRILGMIVWRQTSFYGFP